MRALLGNYNVASSLRNVLRTQNNATLLIKRTCRLSLAVRWSTEK